MTSIQGVLSAFTIILIDLLSRAGLDKVLAEAGNPATVALWAQLQSVVELVSGVALAGAMQGLTVTIAQVNEPDGERRLLRDSLKLGLASSLAAALLAPVLAIWITPGNMEPGLFVLAALSGCIIVVPATLNAYWLGKHLQPRILGLTLLTSSTLLLVAAGAWLGLPLSGLMLVQCLTLLLIAGVVWRYIRSLTHAPNQQQGRSEHFHRLVKFVPVGLMIGIMSPVSMLLVRGMLSSTLSWDDVGFMQALLRSTEWVTATASGVLSLIFMPRFSATFGTAQFRRELMRAGIIVLIPAACLLLLIFFNQRTLLSTLYDTRFVVSNETAALIMLGCLVRIASWVFVFGLFAAHRTRVLMVGEVLSLPLYALLILLFEQGMTLERAALLYLVTYLVYLGFNICGLWITGNKSIDASVRR